MNKNGTGCIQNGVSSVISRVQYKKKETGTVIYCPVSQLVMSDIILFRRVSCRC